MPNSFAHLFHVFNSFIHKQGIFNLQFCLKGHQNMVFMNLLKSHSNLHIRGSDSHNFCYLQVLTTLLMKVLIEAVYQVHHG